MRASIFGAEPGEVRDCVAGLDGNPDVIEDFPVVMVEYREEAVARALVERFGERVFSLNGARLEAVMGEALVAAGWNLSVAESCTGGLIGHLVTNTPGSSAWFNAGFVTYSNEMKSRVLGVSEAVIVEHGAVSREVVEAMALGALGAGSADVAVAVSGIAGPGGGTPEKPVGTVWLASGTREGFHSLKRFWDMDRARIKLAAAHQAIEMVRRECIGAPLE